MKGKRNLNRQQGRWLRGTIVVVGFGRAASVIVGRSTGVGSGGRLLLLALGVRRRYPWDVRCWYCFKVFVFISSLNRHKQAVLVLDIGELPFPAVFILVHLLHDDNVGEGGSLVFGTHDSWCFI